MSFCVIDTLFFYSMLSNVFLFQFISVTLVLKGRILVQLSNGIFLLKRVSRYGRCFMIDSGSKGCPEQESAGCHFGTLGRNFLRQKQNGRQIFQGQI